MFKKKINYKKVLREGIRWGAMILASFLMMSGFLRVIEINTTCVSSNDFLEEYRYSYYDFLFNNCERSGFLNLLFSCDLTYISSTTCFFEYKDFSFVILDYSNFNDYAFPLYSNEIYSFPLYNNEIINTSYNNIEKFK